MNFNITTYLNVFDPKQLFKAALARAIEEGGDASDLLDDQEEINIEACLVMLLDPGSLPGCSIEECSATNDGDMP